MSLTIPIETLSNMKVLFKVGLPAGTFAFDMVPANGPEASGLQLEGGMKLHLSAFQDSTGVTLTLFTTGQSSGRPNEESLDAVFASESNSPPLSGFSEQPFDYGTSHTATDSTSEPERSMDFMSYSQPIAPMPPSEHLDLVLQNLRFGAQENYLFDLQDGSRNFSDFLANPLNLEYNRHHNYDSSVPHSTTDSPAASSVSDLPCSEDTSVTTPDVSSDSSRSSSPPTRSTRGVRSNLRCPEASCARNFTSKYTLSKHIRAHAPKSQKAFPCTMGCAMRFSRKHDRLRHEVTQHGRVCEWGCNACLGFFSSESTLKKHKCRNPGGARWISDQT